MKRVAELSRMRRRGVQTVLMTDLFNTSLDDIMELDLETVRELLDIAGLMTSSVFLEITFSGCVFSLVEILSLLLYKRGTYSMAYCIEESFLLFIETQGKALKDVSEYIRTKNTASGFLKKVHQ